MLRLRLFGIPVAIEGWFWISAVLLGGGMRARDPDDWGAVAIWTAVLLISILVHELGHALAGAYFGAQPGIKLHGFGGVTYLPGAPASRGKSILISLAGPAAGLMLGLLVLLLVQTTPERSASKFLWYAYRQALHINFFWTFVNLLPILPLDGGQVLREVLGPRRLRTTALIGAMLAAGLCAWSLLEREIFLALIMALFAYHNFRQEQVEGGVIKG
jgi:Zn-dependent protease